MHADPQNCYLHTELNIKRIMQNMILHDIQYTDISQ
jgi:hypothetical protein